MAGLVTASERAGASIQRDRSGAAALDEAFESGRSTLTRLGEQGEALHRAEVVADSNQYVVDKSARVVSGMTWTGWIRNKFTALPKPAPPPPPPRSGGASAPERGPRGPRGPPRGVDLEPERSALFAGARVEAPGPGATAAAAPSKTEAALAEQEAYIASLSEGLDDLRGVGAAIGEELDDHEERVPRLQDKMDQLWSTTRQVTRAAGRLTHATAGSTPALLGHVALLETRSRRYLRARGDDVALSDEVDVLRATCRFALHEKRAHLLVQIAELGLDEHLSVLDVVLTARVVIIPVHGVHKLIVLHRIEIFREISGFDGIHPGETAD